MKTLLILPPEDTQACAENVERALKKFKIKVKRDSIETPDGRNYDLLLLSEDPISNEELIKETNKFRKSQGWSEEIEE